MADALRSKDLSEHQVHLAVENKKKKRHSQAKDQRKNQDLSSKTFLQLTPPEKDTLLKTLLLERGLIAPD